VTTYRGKMRWRGGVQRPVFLAPLAAADINMGDLVCQWIDGQSIVPAYYFADQAARAKRCVGVATVCSGVGFDLPIRVQTAGMYAFERLVDGKYVANQVAIMAQTVPARERCCTIVSGTNPAFSVGTILKTQIEFGGHDYVLIDLIPQCLMAPELER